MVENYVKAESKPGSVEFIEKISKIKNIKIAISTSSCIEFFGQNIIF